MCMTELRDREVCLNPYLPSKEHIPDGEPHIFGDRIYVFGSHDLVGTDRYCAGSYVCWWASVDNPARWNYEGKIYSKGQDPYDPIGDKDYYAPDVVQGNDGNYYLYYSINGSYVISVAKAGRPEGPYSFYGHVKTKSGHVIGSVVGDDYQFDPAVINDEGHIYLYSGQGIPIDEIDGRKVKGAMFCELEDDMLTIKGEQKVITSNDYNRFDSNPFFEASSIRKIDGKYYFIYSPLPNTHNLCYATSAFPDGDFEYQGVLVSNGDIFENSPEGDEPLNYWGNNHGSILDLGNGNYYIFYHRNTNKCPYARQGCVERLERDENGKFLQAEVTSFGMSNGSLPLDGKYPAYSACILMKKDMQPFKPFEFLQYDDSDPYITEDEECDIEYIRNIKDGATVGFRYFEALKEEYLVKITARGEGELEIIQNGNSVGTVNVSGNDWHEFTNVISLDIGKTDLRFVYHGSDSIDMLCFEFE